MIMMKRLCAGLAGVLSLLALWAAPAAAWNRGHAEIFAVLPAGSTGPGGLAVGPAGKVYITTIGVNNKSDVPQHGQPFRFSPTSNLLLPVTLTYQTNYILGVLCNPVLRL